MLSPNEYEPSEEQRAEIRTRLAGVCRGYDEADLEALVREIAYVHAKYERLKTERFVSAARELAASTRSMKQTGGRPPRAD